jgi:hypothetical protein
MAVMQLSTTPQLLRNATRSTCLPAVRRSVVPMRSRMIVRAEEQATEQATEAAEPTRAPPPQPKQKSSWEVRHAMHELYCSLPSVHISVICCRASMCVYNHHDRARGACVRCDAIRCIISGLIILYPDVCICFPAAH